LFTADRDRFETKNKNSTLHNRKGDTFMSARKADQLLLLPEFVPVFRTKREPLAGPRQPGREKRGTIAWANVYGTQVMVWYQKGLWWVIDPDPVARQAVQSVGATVLDTAEGSIGDFRDEENDGRGRE
jgi:hypothetical protein